jgi:hypothetical protein
MSFTGVETMITIVSTRPEQGMQAGMPIEQSAEYLTIKELGAHCQREIENFRRTGLCDDQFALEVFRRAVLAEHETTRDDAWSIIFHLFAPLVLSWISQDPRSPVLLHEDIGKDSLINAIFAKMALTFQRAPGKIVQFSTLSALLKYLKLTSHTIIADEVRARKQKFPIADIAEADDLSVGDITDNVALDEHTRIFWRVVEEETFDNELLYLKLTFLDGMKPAEIVASYPQEFPEVEEVYRIRRNVVERLARNRRIHRLRDEQNELRQVV